MITPSPNWSIQVVITSECLLRHWHNTQATAVAVGKHSWDWKKTPCTAIQHSRQSTLHSSLVVWINVHLEFITSREAGIETYKSIVYSRKLTQYPADRTGRRDNKRNTFHFTCEPGLQWPPACTAPRSKRRKHCLTWNWLIVNRFRHFWSESRRPVPLLLLNISIEHWLRSLKDSTSIASPSWIR